MDTKQVEELNNLLTPEEIIDLASKMGHPALVDMDFAKALGEALLAKLSQQTDEKMVDIIENVLHDHAYYRRWEDTMTCDLIDKGKTIIKKLSPIIQARIAKAVEEAEERGIKTATEAYESTCEALIREARKEERAELLKQVANDLEKRYKPRTVIHGVSYVMHSTLMLFVERLRNGTWQALTNDKEVQ